MLMIIDMEPKTPTVDGGNHVNAIKSKVEAATDKNIAIMNKGLVKTVVFSGCGRFEFLVLGSWKKISC